VIVRIFELCKDVYYLIQTMLDHEIRPEHTNLKSHQINQNHQINYLIYPVDIVKVAKRGRINVD
jgi:hypothetical protein